jgi:4'-phosphopantetheinyl transferase
MSSTCIWGLSPLALVLPRDEIHVWRIPLQQPIDYVERLAKILSRDEQIRAESFRFERDRRRFIVGRGTLRIILGRYLCIEPEHLKFCYGLHGKPCLAQEHNPYSIQFNLAHSNELALCALTCSGEIGIDLEYVQPLPDAEQIASRFFAKNELTRLLMLHENQRAEIFLTYWTCKEAFIKAVGDGLARPLDQFEILLAPGEQPRLFIKGEHQESSRWSIQTLTPEVDYMAALVIDRFDLHLVCWQWCAS